MRSSSITFFALMALLFLGVLWYGTTPATPPADPNATEVAFSEVARGEQSTVTTRENYLITTPEQMKQLWSLITTTTPMPSVDFDTYQVIALFAGKEPSAGYTISARKITDGTENRAVVVEINAPGATCVAAQVTTTPYQILLLPKTTLTLTHTDIATTTSCWQ